MTFHSKCGTSGILKVMTETWFPGKHLPSYPLATAHFPDWIVVFKARNIKGQVMYKVTLVENLLIKCSH